MEKLISMVDFVKQENEKIQSELCLPGFTNNVSNYANFLSQKLELWMFIPCKFVGGVWVVLEEPEHYQGWYKWGSFSKHGDSIVKKCSDYHAELKEAKDRVFFEGFTIVSDMYLQTKRTFYFTGKLRIASKYEYHSGEIKLNFDLNHDNKTIEDLVKYNLELTETAKKEIGL